MFATIPVQPGLLCASAPLRINAVEEHGIAAAGEGRQGSKHHQINDLSRFDTSAILAADQGPAVSGRLDEVRGRVPEREEP